MKMYTLTKCGPFNIKAQAYLHKGVTKIYIKIFSNNVAVPVSGSLESVFISSQSSGTQDTQTCMFKNVPIVKGTAIISTEGFERGQKLDIQVLIWLKNIKKRIKLSTLAKILLSPDLVVDNVQSPSSVASDCEFEVLVGIAEKNGDAGAAANIAIYKDNTLWASVQQVKVTPGGYAQAIFRMRIHETGSFVFKIVLSGTIPEDFINGNIEASFNITVENAAIPMQCNSRFEHVLAVSTQTGNSSYTENEDFEMTLDYGEVFTPCGQFHFKAKTEHGIVLDQVFPITGFDLCILNGITHYHYSNAAILTDIDITLDPACGTRLTYRRYAVTEFDSENSVDFHEGGGFWNAINFLEIDCSVALDNGNWLSGNHRITINRTLAISEDGNTNYTKDLGLYSGTAN